MIYMRAMNSRIIKTGTPKKLTRTATYNAWYKLQYFQMGILTPTTNDLLEFFSPKKINNPARP